jgi:hypothetical protein
MELALGGHEEDDDPEHQGSSNDQQTDQYGFHHVSPQSFLPLKAGKIA